MKINCTNCTEDSRKNGCSRCGGYGIILEKTLNCSICKEQGWLRPGPFTIYEGKEVYSYDGNTFIMSLKPSNTKCITCAVLGENNEEDTCSRQFERKHSKRIIKSS